MDLLEALRALAGWDLAQRDGLDAFAVVVAEANPRPQELASGLRLLVERGDVGAEVLVLANRVLGSVDQRAEAQRAASELLEHLSACDLHDGSGLEVAVSPRLLVRRGQGPVRVDTCTWRILPDELAGWLGHRRRWAVVGRTHQVVFVEGRRLLEVGWPWPALAPSLRSILAGEGSNAEAT